MENGLILAIIASISFSLSIVLVRRATAEAGESFSATAVSIFIGIPFFAIALFITGDWGTLSTVSIKAWILLGAAGIIHFVFGRFLSYNAYRLIGANKATPFIMTNPFYTVLFSVLFLKEAITIYLIVGVICIFAGAALITTERKSAFKQEQNKLTRLEVKGIFYSLVGALCWGISPVLIKPAVREIGSPFVGAFIAYIAASIVMALLLLQRRQRMQIGRLHLISALLPMIVSAIFACTGHSFVYNALVYSPASMVTPLISTQVLFIFLLSFLLNHKVEVFTVKIAMGMVMVLIGTFLLFQ